VVDVRLKLVGVERMRIEFWLFAMILTDSKIQSMHAGTAGGRADERTKRLLLLVILRRSIRGIVSVRVL